MNANQMVNWIDRREIAAARERRMRRRLRKLPPKLRKFCLALKRVMVDEPGPEIYGSSCMTVGIRSRHNLI